MLLFIKIVYIFVFCLSTSRFVSLNETYLSRNKQKMVSTFTYTCKSRSALDCGVTCSLDDDCWSLSFNDATGVCLLSDIRANVIQDDWIVDENWQTLTKTVKTIGSACVVGSDCIEINSICLYSICHCDSTTKYTHATWSCDKECDNYGSTFTVYENLAIDGYNHHRTHITLSLADCKQACIDMGNACGSVDYSDVLQECWLQTATYQQVLEADSAAFKLFGGTYSIYSRHC